MTLTAFEHAARAFEPSPAERWMYDPVAWARDCINWDTDAGLAFYQNAILDALVQHHRVAIRGPHGLGKTAIAAIVIWWFATTRDAAGIDWKIIATASAWRHLSAFLFPECKKWARLIDWEKLGRAPIDHRRELLDLHVKLKYGAATAVASNDAAKIEGAHADSLLYVIDESKTVPVDTWDAIEGAFSGGHSTGLPEAFALALSTPGQAAGRFYEIHRRAPGLEDWHPIHVTLADAMKAGRISPEWAQQRKRQWGADSAMYTIRVLGEFHAGDDDALIPLSWVEAAVERWHAWVDAGKPPLEGRRVIGVDVARTGSDETVFAHRIGHAITRLEPVNATDTMAVVARVQAALATAGRDTVAVVDSMGVGGGVVDRLRELGVKPLAYTGAGKTTRKDRTGEYGAVNVRSAAYWNLRELLNPAYDSTVLLPPSDELTADLTTPRWDVTSGVPPKIKVETKDDVVARLGRSPDRGDAVAQAFWADAMHTSTRLLSAPKDQKFGTSSLGSLAR